MIEISALIDSGAAVNIINESVLNTLRPRPQLIPANIEIFPYGCTNPLPKAGHKTAEELGIIKILNCVSSPSSRTVADELVDSYPELFQGIGKLKDFQVQLHINTDIQPTCQPHRRVPFHIRQKVKEELKKLEEEDIIETVTGPTPWVSPIMTLPKPKDPYKVRICLNMRQANTAIRERHITSTMDDVIHELNGATVFSKLNLDITTEVIQNAICQTLQGISGVKNLSDDIVVHGKTQADHDNSLRAVFLRLNERADGITDDPRKVAAIQQASDPTEVRSLLGMANYCSLFVEDFASMGELTKKDTIWHWGPEQAKALQVIRDSLTSDTVMSYFDASKETELIVDASPVGLGAILYQRNKEGTGERTRAEKVAEEYVNFVAQHATPKAMTLAEIKDETLKDPILQKSSEADPSAAQCLSESQCHAEGEGCCHDNCEL
ncbi:hypothetical protein SKAU_G00067760 [Synaphobranchus kaupii]|uniref:Reverse transcriptase/retrotransposon-derived protein RNase H-like domain-containing protein n=1 Tax=Synaphobranchus kaupii TaxID=118154 RepID=A0A9Q1G6K8_SYNKA|nr:hypothetical protein SKAU_G00067760 [Synaphobranchus kaupii]